MWDGRWRPVTEGIGICESCIYFLRALPDRNSSEAILRYQTDLVMRRTALTSESRQVKLEYYFGRMFCAIVSLMFIESWIDEE